MSLVIIIVVREGHTNPFTRIGRLRHPPNIVWCARIVGIGPPRARHPQGHRRLATRFEPRRELHGLVGLFGLTVITGIGLIGLTVITGLGLLGLTVFWAGTSRASEGRAHVRSLVRNQGVSFRDELTHTLD